MRRRAWRRLRDANPAGSENAAPALLVVTVILVVLILLSVVAASTTSDRAWSWYW